jgi:hypothetical protein
VSDARFDQLYPEPLRAVSTVHFTPVSVAVRASLWLAGGGAADILDVGAGAGKLCLIGAAVTGARFTGVERRAHLVSEAVALGRRLGLDRTRFLHGEAQDLPWDGFQAFYLFNPFGEAASDPEEWIDAAAAAPASASAALAEVLRRLVLMPPGTRVAVYCGLGAPMPPGYHLEATETRRVDAGKLELWLRT